MIQPTFGSLFAGIRGFDLALTRAGCRGVFAAEIDKQANSVGRRHFKDETTVTDVRDVRGPAFRCDILCAGWPCQGNSVAGKRAGLADDRSGLWWEVVRVLANQKPAWFFGENVPGALSVNRGRDWAVVLGSLAKLGYGFAYRVLDAQYDGVPQRRQRVFLVGCLGDWRRAAEVLFEPDCLPWDSPPSREAGEGVAGTLGAHSSSGRSYRSCPIPDNLIPVSSLARCVTSREGRRLDPSLETLIPVAYRTAGDGAVYTEGDVVAPLTTGTDPSANIVAFQTRIARNGRGQPKDVIDALTSCAGGTHADSKPHLAGPFGVRRATPLECERFQGFPDGWTEFGEHGERMADGPRYRMLGNAVAVPCVEWIARRIVTNCRAEVQHA